MTFLGLGTRLPSPLELSVSEKPPSTVFRFKVDIGECKGEMFMIKLDAWIHVFM